MALAKIPKLTLTFCKASKMSKEGGSWESICISSLMWNVEMSMQVAWGPLSYLQSSLLISFKQKINSTIIRTFSG